MHHEQPINTFTITLKTLRLANILILVLLCSAVSASCYASDMEREQRLAEMIKNTVSVGEVISLQAPKGEFIGLINNQEPDQAHGSVLILHGMGANPNSSEVIYPLRNQLANLGWVTAAVQLPVLEKNATVKEYLALIPSSEARIKASLDYMRENFKNRPCVIIAHSLGATMAANFLAKQQSLACDALVLISLPAFSSELPEALSLEHLEKIKIPSLDIFGSQDLASVKATAMKRKLALLKNNPLNRQIVVAGADHHFNGLSDTLVHSIHGWLIHTFKPPKQ